VSDDPVVLRPGSPSEASALLELALRSKAVWGYTPAFLEACRDELRLTASQFAQSRVVVAVAPDDKLLGYSKFSGRAAAGPELEALFVEPSEIGTGIGRRLYSDVVEYARGAGLRSFRIEADPNAVPFYERMGAVIIGATPSGSIAGRELPVLRFDT
jgi:GNAT superfamily N-acetyltransferase